MTDHYTDGNTPYRDEEWLREKYWDDGLSSAEIGQLCDVGQQTISRWLRRNDIETRSSGGLPRDLPYKDPDWLREQYLDEGMSQTDIADECGVTLDTIQRWMGKFDIEARDYGGYDKDALFKKEDWLRQKYEVEELTLKEMAGLTELDSEVTLLRWMDHHDISRREPSMGNNAHLSNHAIEFIDGLLLGDGHLSLRKGALSAVYEHSDSERRYVEWLSNKLVEFGIKQSGKIQSLPNGSYSYKSLSYRDLKPLLDRWYVDGIRQLPNDLEPTPTLLKNWYIGDGKRRKGDVWFTLDFQTKDHSIDSFQSLRSDIADRGIMTTISEGRLFVESDSEGGFYEYILSSDGEIPPGYAYKFP